MKRLQNNFKPLLFLVLAGFAFTSCSSDDDNSPTIPEPTSYQVSINASPSNGGTVSPQSGEFEKDQVINITATPLQGWEFKEWQGDVTGIDNPIQLAVNATKNITAVFERDLFYLADNGVTIMAPNAPVGGTGVINGITYTKRTVDQITPENAETTCTSGITDMSNLFNAANTFNGDISHWDVSTVTNMNNMFQSTDVFNADLSNWDVSSVTNMGTLFNNALVFNSDLSNWDVSSVTVMNGIFAAAAAFNADLSNWDVSNVTTMRSMFNGASSFNSDLNSWDMSSVTNTGWMFFNASSFNGDITDWNVSNVTAMDFMFHEASNFNRDISNWNVGNVTNMLRMFADATSFNQNISGWCVTNLTSEPNDFASGSPLSSSNKPIWGTCP
ncbi:BspA family leucine-rich repeat surface protein [Bizionia argentinensis JUB59]|uniref:BspA family leucine-rich repeat surface protein n=1 Tax=Bizionia argentinensis JUB59 TaxID=1046627 RepID=G2EGT9_9FLAO|nr:BspA family leucine-rich repeat surface protein [Bizionia argentinensis]EGV42334.2 BspA family leucine-rich repeat surface protein [Bizionia argentinensis JUB59]